MELLCTHCQQKLSIPDQFAGQLMRCPLCSGTFTAPALGPTPVPVPPLPPDPVPPPAPPPPPDALYSLAPEPPPPPLPILEEPRQVPVKETPPLAPPPPPGDYTRSRTVWISPRIVPWITPVGLFIVFILTFFPWLSLYLSTDFGDSRNAWSLGFGHNSNPMFGVYLILVLLAFIASIPSALFALGLAPPPPAIKALGPWRPVIVGGVAALAFLFLAVPYIELLFKAGPTTIWIKFSIRVHFVVIVASLLESWLEIRRRKNLPLPRIEMHW